MEENKIKITAEELAKIAGGVAIGGSYYDFRIDIYEGDKFIDWLPCAGLDNIPARSLRFCIRQQRKVSAERIHIYLPSGAELNYEGTFADNGLGEGMLLKAVIDPE